MFSELLAQARDFLDSSEPLLITVESRGEGDDLRLMLGEVEELWDSAAIAMYPSRKAMMEMISSPDYQASAVHRAAGLAGQLNIELVEPVGAWLMQQQS